MTEPDFSEPSSSNSIAKIVRPSEGEVLIFILRQQYGDAVKILSHQVIAPIADWPEVMVEKIEFSDQDGSNKRVLLTANTPKGSEVKNLRDDSTTSSEYDLARQVRRIINDFADGIRKSLK